ncbi:MAG: ribosomal-protein-alanine N-acetyltransferase [Chloroflexi bacterium]|nr:ribosomal-protein-alanine N-acetyltransferase [Chloroflexota bacterium]MYB84973.1 ribosomal-protein-alanine N-acetyltransferase [Chloroflexota bacterium]
MRREAVLPYSLRPMDWADLDQVAAMERESFPTLWPPTNYRREMRNRTAEYLVCVRDGEYLTVEREQGALRRLFRRNKPEPPERRRLLAGFLGVWHMAGEAHIVSIAVREDYRRRGLGELLVIGAIEMGMARGAQVVTLEARVSNEPAIALYTKYGFHEAGIRRRYYADNHEDAVIMTTDALDSADYRALFERLRNAFDERYGEAVREYIQ